MTSAWSSRRGRRLLAAGSALVLLLAVLPSVLYLGHWPLPGPHAAELPSSAGDALREHAGHCHLISAACGDQPGGAVAWWVGGQRWALPADAAPQEVGSGRYQALPEPSLLPLKPPPRVV